MTKDVIASYRTALGLAWPLVLIHLIARLLAAAVFVPLSGILLSLALAATGQGAVTDQDIARFLLGPVGLITALALISLAIIAAIFEIAVMTGALRRQERHAMRAVLSGIGLILGRIRQLFGFGFRLVLRIVAIAAPFLLAVALVAWATLGQYDINFYLTHRPPAFVAAAAILGALLVALAALLVARLTSWALALHLLLFGEVSARRSFSGSADLLRGRRLDVLGRILLWFLVRMIVIWSIAALFVALSGWAQQLFGPDLRGLALCLLALLLVWGLANAVVTALANGALAALLDGLYCEATGEPTEWVEPAASQPFRRRNLMALIGVATLLLAGGIVAGGAVLENVSAERQVEIIAHRGSAGSRPENSMAAIEQALDDGADWVEIDVQETADGEVVVAHDSDFMKVAGVDLNIWDATMDDLAAIDIGSWFDPAFADQRTPTLREALVAARGRGNVLIELKYYGHDVALESRVTRIVEETGMSGQVAVMSLKIPGVETIQGLRPHWPSGILAATALGDISTLEADFLAVNTGQASLGLIRRVHAQGRKLYVWTVDDPATMVRMISMGVDGLITNEPALARRVMEERNRLSAPERLLLWLSSRLQLQSFDLAAEETDA